MERKRFESAPCSIARSLDVLGDHWTPLILRECLYGVHRFDAIQRWLGIGRNILTRRLQSLEEQGVVERRQYEERPPRYEYHLTEKGYDAARLLMAMMAFGQRWYFRDGLRVGLHRTRGRRQRRAQLRVGAGFAGDVPDLEVRL